MKKYIAIVVLSIFVIGSLFAMPVYAQDNVIDKIGDWAATVGKDEPQKSMILSQRRADRAAKRAQKELEKTSKQAAKSAKNIFGQ